MKNDSLIYFRSVMEQMTTEQLDELLHEELTKAAPNGEVVRQALNILEDREKDIPVEMTPEVMAAWNLYRDTQEPVQSRPFFQRRRILKTASVAAVLAVLVIALSQPAAAKSFFERLLGFTGNFFQLISPGDDGVSSDEYIFQTNNPGLQEVYNAVVKLGITDPVVPMWLPEGYELVSFKVAEVTTYKCAHAVFSDGSSTFTFKVYMYSKIVTNEYNKDDLLAETLEIKGRIHNVIHNENLWASVWTKENIECTITVDCQEDTFFRILKSIYTMEDA